MRNDGLFLVTMRPSETLQANRNSILAIVERMGGRNVRVFGSVVRGEDTDASDIDLLVDVPDDATLLDMVRLQSDIERVVGVRVDVLTNDDLPQRMRDMVLREARPL